MRTWWQLRRLVPAIMVLAAAANLALSFRKMDWLAFRAWEAAIWVDQPAGAGPFQPDSRIRIAHAYGDLAGLGNVRDVREYRPEEFRVDHFGFRDSGGPHRNPVGFVIGDSFATGAALSDSETLPARLTEDAGGFFYNASGEQPCLANAEAAASILRLDSGVVVFELLERNARHDPPKLSELRFDCFPVKPDWHAWRLPAGLPGAKALELAVGEQAPARILSRKTVKLLENGEWLPNPYRAQVVRRTLKNGDEMLFYPDDFKQGTDPGGALEDWRDYIIAFSARMTERHIKTIVLLVPNKATVYAPFISSASADFHGGESLAGIQDRLRLAGVPVVNVTTPFQESARRGLASHDYIYWRDDTHWNPRGVKLAADCVLAEIRKEPSLSATLEPRTQGIASEVSRAAR